MDWDERGEYKMLDAEWLAGRYPDTFKVPGAVAKANLQPNDFVKIFFEDRLMPEFPERLWVQVDDWDLNYGGVGRLANMPYCISALYGDEVTFEAKHIMAIMKREEYNAKGEFQVPAVTKTFAAPRRLALCAKVED